VHLEKRGELVVNGGLGSVTPEKFGTQVVPLGQS